MAKSSKYLPIEKPCRSLSTGDNFLCTANHQVVYPEPTCIERLMKFANDLSHCKLHQIQLEEIKVQRINTNSWILYTQFETTLTKQCGSEISKQLILGTYLVTIDDPCDLELKGVRIHHHIYTETDTVEPIPVIMLLQLLPTENISSASALNMHGISLDELKYMAYSLKHSEVIESVFDEKQSYKFSASLGYVTLSFVILSILLFTLYVFRVKCLKLMLCQENYQEKSEIDCPDNFHLKEGGVMVASQPSVLE